MQQILRRIGDEPRWFKRGETFTSKPEFSNLAFRDLSDVDVGRHQHTRGLTNPNVITAWSHGWPNHGTSPSSPSQKASQRCAADKRLSSAAALKPGIPAARMHKSGRGERWVGSVGLLGISNFLASNSSPWPICLRRICDQSRHRILRSRYGPVRQGQKGCPPLQRAAL